MKRVARYETLVYPSNRHSGHGVPVTVYADNVSEAKKRAVEIGWGGHPTDALVAIQSVHDTEPAPEGA